jgi:hypothetical protein
MLTLFSALKGTLGIVTCVQLVPFQWKAAPKLTPHASEGDRALTLCSGPTVVTLGECADDGLAAAVSDPASATLLATTSQNRHGRRIG